MRIKKQKNNWNSFTLSECLQSSELKRRLLFTLLLLLLIRLGGHIPIPGIPKDLLANNPLLAGNLINMYDLFAGGTLAALSIFALGIGPYISVSIMMQLLTVALPTLKALREQGDYGQRKIKRITRYLTLVLAIIESFGLAKMLGAAAATGALMPLPLLYLIVIGSLTAATMVTMWIAELITEKGIGNGSSLLICAGIVSRLPLMVHDTWVAVDSKLTSAWAVALMLGVLALAGAAAVVLQQGMKKLPVLGGSGKTARSGNVPETQLYLPINPAGVMPVIFASQIIFFLQMFVSYLIEQCSRFNQALLQDKHLGSFWNALSSNAVFHTSTLTLWAEASNIFDYAHWEYYILYTVLILFFSLFYTEITLPPEDISDSLRRSNRTIAGVKPGTPTITYLRKTTQKLAIVGAAAVALLTLIPTQLAQLTQVQTLLGFGSTSLIILTGVALDTQRQISACVASSRTHKGQLLPPAKDDNHESV